MIHILVTIFFRDVTLLTLNKVSLSGTTPIITDREGHHSSWWFLWSSRKCVFPPLKSLKRPREYHMITHYPWSRPRVVVILVVMEASSRQSFLDSLGAK